MPPIELLFGTIAEAYVQVSGFVAVTVLLFSYVQYRTKGRLVAALRSRERLQPLAGALLGLVPGCGGALVVMPLYVHGSVSFGTVVATIIATAGDSAFVILALAPQAGLYAYGLALGAALVTGYAIDTHGVGVERVDRAVAKLGRPATDGGAQTAETGESGERPGVLHNGGHEYGGAACDAGTARSSPVLTPLSHAVHLAWWAVAFGGVSLAVYHLTIGAPEVDLALGASFAGAFTVVGIVGALLSVYVYFVGRHYVGDGRAGAPSDSFASAYETLTHAAVETSFVTVWVLGGYLLYEYGMFYLQVDVAAVAAAAGVIAPLAGAAIGMIPGCGPQIILATAYAEGSIPFSALAANAISQDGDALFPLIAIDLQAAVVATVYTTLPALVVGVAVHLLFGPAFGFGVLG